MTVRTSEPLEGVASAQGLDVSNFQGKFSWAATSGLSFGIHRLTQGLGGAGLNSPDPTATWNHQQIAAKGLIRGAYHFLDPSQDGAAQARYYSAAYTTLGLRPADMMWLDSETSGRQNAAEVSACARAFMAELKSLHPRQPMGVYTFISFATGGFCDGLGSWPLWLAYPASGAPKPPPPWARWTFWQWGLRNGDDADAFNGTAAQLGAWVESFAPAAPVPPAPKPPAAPSAKPSLHVATGKQSLAQFAAAAARTGLEVVWLTAQNQPSPGPAQAGYLGGILDGTVKATAAMPAGMNVWG
ncbi:MAG: glycoside hydrolase family 25 protein [Actinomycetota bacterium]|nr:glycoside hydrolase family 25 protein [Actinomycetota bacterium]